MTQPPTAPKLYHIVHVDRLPSIVADGRLLCDEVMTQRAGSDTTIGMSRIKERRLRLPVESHPGLLVGGCVPFYFCPRSVMLYLLHQGNHPDLAYRGGQEPIVHLELNLQDVIVWARSKDLRWAMTLSNAGAYGFEDRCSLESLNEIDWNAVHATNWRDPDVKHRKQAEFLVERRCSWRLVQRVGVLSDSVGQKVLQAIQDSSHKPDVVIRRDWYY